MRVLLWAVSGQWFAVELGRCREVVTSPCVTSLPLAPPALLGLTSRAGELIPVVDTAALLGLESEPAHFLAVVETKLGPVGLALEASPETAELDQAVPAPQSGAGVAAVAAYRSAQPDGTARLVVLLDPLALVAPRREPSQ